MFPPGYKGLASFPGACLKIKVPGKGLAKAYNLTDFMEGYIHEIL